MELKYTKNIACLVPFIELAIKVAKVDPSKIKRCVGYNVPIDRSHQQAAQIIKRDRRYTLTFRVSEPEYKNLGDGNFRKLKNTPLYLENVLDSIAHEVSHLVHWDHDYKHFRLQGKIKLEFAKLLKQLGVEDTAKRYDRALSKVEQ
jgi:hypothetical protein